MIQKLEVVRAGAGSGKTTDLCRCVAQAVVAGLDPARVLATTFTKKAAAELKGRIQAELFAGTGRELPAHVLADRLELAAVGTVHSVAHQLISRYAIDMGLSPRLEVVTELAAGRALGDLLGTIPVAAWQPLAACAERLGIDDLQQRILTLLAAKRGNRISDADFTAHMAESADRVCQLLAPGGAAATEEPMSLLYDLAERALADINALDNDTQQNTNIGRQRLRRLCSRRVPLWGSYLLAARVAAGKRSGADGMLDALRNHAASVRQNPRLHADIQEFSALLAAQTVGLDARYRAYKTERGLVDFTDLEVLLLELLGQERLAERLAEDFDLILVDEFQDTNPLQLAIFRQLRRLAPRSRWVGDPKQAVYGFRDTDPQLVNDTWNSAAADLRTELTDNHRSQRGLVQVVAALFGPIFGAEAKQKPQKPAQPRGVERWVLEARNQSDDATALACGIAKLHAEGIPFGEIAILERTNRLLSMIAEAFDAAGIPYLLESPGLLSTREGATVLAGLRLVADRSDSLAAATVLHLLSDPQQATPDWITDRLLALQVLRDGAGGADAETPPTYSVPWAGDKRFARLESISRSLLSPTVIAQQVIEALNLPALVPRWGDPGRRCSHLDSLLRHIREYEEIALNGGQAATLSGLILYLEQLAEDQLDVRYPPQGHDAVTLTTYHSAKGLEWPVVVLGGLGFNRSPGMWAPVVAGGEHGDADPLAGRVLRSWTWPFGNSDGPFGKRRKGSGLETDALASPEGQERERRETEESLRLLYVGCTRAKHKLVFAHRDGQYTWLAKLPTVDSLLDCNRGEGEHELEGIDTSFVVRHLESSMADDCRCAPSPQERWLSVPAHPNPTEYVARFHSPSQAAAGPDEGTFQLEEFSGQPYFPSGAVEDQYAAIGDAVHSYLAALPSVRTLAAAAKQRVALRCVSAFSVSGVLSPHALIDSGEHFCDWVENRYPGARWHVEMNVSGPRAAGGRWNGAIDLLLQLPSGELVIIDHKSAPIRRAYCAAKAGQYTGQLAAYSEVLRAAGETVESTWIHFPLAGVIAKRVC